jgi:hypothetical protein
MPKSPVFYVDREAKAEVFAAGIVGMIAGAAVVIGRS